MKTSLLPLVISTLASALLLSHCTTTTGGGGGSGSLPPATRDAPFVNSLGMKFVPVPGTNILMCTTETTVGQYQAAGLGYQAPEFAQGSDHPAVNVSWNDANAWCAWLSKRDGHRYRLPKEAEWSAAVGGGTHPWGNQWPPPNNAGNYAGEEMTGCTEAERALFWKGFLLIGGFRDQHKFTAPVGSYPVNHLGIHDLGGNVSELCREKYDSSTDSRVSRGGCFGDANRGTFESSDRNEHPPDYRSFFAGFRCVVVMR